VTFPEPTKSVSLNSVFTQDDDKSNNNNNNIITISISILIFRKWDVRIWTGWSWLRIGTDGGHLRMQ
jgi:hypothetical protein